MCQEFHHRYTLCNHVDGNPHGEIAYCKGNCGVPDWELIDVPALCRVCKKHHASRLRQKRLKKIFCCGG